MSSWITVFPHHCPICDKLLVNTAEEWETMLIEHGDVIALTCVDHVPTVVDQYGEPMRVLGIVPLSELEEMIT